MTSLQQEKPTVEALLKESGRVVKRLRNLRHVRQVKAVESVGYRRKLFNILNVVESLTLKTNVQDSTKQQLVDEFERTKCHIEMAVRISLVHLHKLCEFDTSFRRKEALEKICKSFDKQMETRNQKEPEIHDKVSEENIFSDNFSPTDFFNNQSNESDSNDIDLFDLLTQYGVDFPI